ncbi:MAG TPA: 3-oxoacyl-[acyl-carrier-protein] reductase [bacterium]|nr:3-oxoacyl-[acyl-carrier-protein] reductase [bacterium]
MLNGKVTIITGACGGIGSAIAYKFGENGAKIVLWDVMKSEVLIKNLEEKKIDFMYDEIDITDSKSVEEGAKKVMERYGKIDILINNAGITKDSLIFRMKEEDWEKVIGVNLKGAFLCTKIIGKLMFAKRSGKIINIASIIGEIGNIGQANYSASKGGLIALTKTCAREFAKAGINVNAISPGYIMTPMTEKLSEKIKEEIKNRIPLGRFGKPEEVAELALFLASEKANYITGQVIRVDGGLVM